MPDVTLPSHGMWAGGGVDQLLSTAVPLLIMAGMVMMTRHALRAGVRLFTPPPEPGDAVELEQLDAAAPTADDDGAPPRAQAYDGFDPSMYGSVPSPDPGEADGDTSATST